MELLDLKLKVRQAQLYGLCEVFARQLGVPRLPKYLVPGSQRLAS